MFLLLILCICYNLYVPMIGVLIHVICLLTTAELFLSSLQTVLYICLCSFKYAQPYSFLKWSTTIWLQQCQLAGLCFSYVYCVIMCYTQSVSGIWVQWLTYQQYNKQPATISQLSAMQSSDKQLRAAGSSLCFLNEAASNKSSVPLLNSWMK